MAVRPVLKMGDPLLLQVARPVQRFDSVELAALLEDMHETMEAQNGAGLAAPQIGVSQQVVIFGVARNPRYPQAEEVPYTVLINPQLEPVSDEMEEGWEGCLSVPGMRGLVPRYTQLRYRGFDQSGKPDRSHGGRLPRPRRAARGRSSATASCTRCASAICGTSVSTKRCSPDRICRTTEPLE